MTTSLRTHHLTGSTFLPLAVALTFATSCGSGGSGADGGATGGGPGVGGGSAMAGGAATGGGSATGGGATAGGLATGGGSTGDDGGLIDAGVAPDAGPPTPPAPMAHRFNGPVWSALHAGDAWFIGGEFDRAETTIAGNLVGLDLTGAATGCSVREGVSDGTQGPASVLAMAKVGNALFIGGDFRKYRGQPANFIAKLDATTCALDTAFSPPGANGFDNVVYALAPSSSGASLFVGGQFRGYRGEPENTWYLAKLDVATGQTDEEVNGPGTYFPTGSGNAVDNPVLALAVDGNTLYLGGNFTRWRGVNNSAINLARVNATDGTQDTTFSPVGVGLNGTDGQVAALALSGASLFVGGSFSGYRGVANSARGIAKLDKLTGALDTTFSPPANNGFIGFPQVYALATTQDSIYVGGLFLGYRGVMGAGRNLAKLSLADGALDTTFSPPSVSGFDREVRALKVVGSTLLVGGAFTDYRGAPRSAPGLAALELTTGALSASFRASPTDAPGVSREPGAQAAVHALVVDGLRLWVGGSFAHYGGKQVDGLARFRDDTGRVDLTFSPPSAEGLRDGASSAQVTALAAHGGSLLVGGSFTSYRGVANSARRLARLNQTTGALDTAFSPPGANGFDSDVYALAVSGDALFVGGDFSAYRGVAGSANALARLDAVSGAIDTTFSPPGATANGFDSSVYALAVNGGALFVGGDFTTRYGAAMVPAARLAKLDAVTGAVDATFTMAGSGADDTVRALAVSGSGLFVGGDFTTYRGAPAPRLMKLDLSTGARVAAFGGGGFDQTVYGLAAVGDAVFVAGHFTAYRGVPASASFVARLDGASGALDTTFTPSGAPSGAPFSMYVVAPYLDALFVGGRFSFCDSNGCVQNSTRVNQQTRAIQ